MNKFLPAIFIALFFHNTMVSASPEEDLTVFQNYFEDRFPDTEFNDYQNGVYSIHPSVHYKTLLTGYHFWAMNVLLTIKIPK